MSCSPLKVNQCFRGTCLFHLQGQIRTRYQHESRALCWRLHCILLNLFDPENGGDTFLHNVSWLSSDYMALYPSEQGAQESIWTQVGWNSKRLKKTASWGDSQLVRFEVFTVVTMKRAIFWDVRFEVFTAVTMKNGVFWDVMPCGSCKNQRFRGT
jgi:hypothetical protein